MSPDLGFFFGQSFPGIYMRQCTPHKHLQTPHQTQLEGTVIFLILGVLIFSGLLLLNPKPSPLHVVKKVIRE